MKKKAKAGAAKKASKPVAKRSSGRPEPKPMDVKPMDIEQWRDAIDILDRQVVDLIGKRAAVAHEIGRIKKERGLPIYEPAREKAVLANVKKANKGILADRDMISIFERIMDMMRKIQQEEIAPETVE